MVLRRSTTRWTCDSDRRSSARSTVTFMLRDLARWLAIPRERNSHCGSPGASQSRVQEQCQERSDAPAQAGAILSTPGVEIDPAAWIIQGRGPQGGGDFPRFSLFLQLALERFDLLGERRIVADEVLDLAHRVQHRRMVAAAEAPAYFRQRT